MIYSYKITLGTHSIRKYAATVARKSDFSKDSNVDYRARWKSKLMQDNYVGMELSWPDISFVQASFASGVLLFTKQEKALVG